MKLRTLGRTGYDVSEIGFGAWAIGGGWGEQADEDSIHALHAAFDAGINFVDTAAGYGNGRSERVIAQALRDRSERVYVATKTPPAPGPWPPSPYCQIDDRYSPAYLRENVEERLRCLDVDCLDLLQLHTWTCAWNDHPRAFDTLRELRDEGKIAAIGVSTPEQDQNAVIDLMRQGYLDTVQVIYNIFEQEPAAALLPAAAKFNVGVIVRVVFDEGSLTGKWTAEHVFPKGDWRARYFAGDRLARTVERVEKIRADVADASLTMPEVALKFALAHPAVSTVIAGARSVEQARANAAVSEKPDLSVEQLQRLHRHAWLRGFWNIGK